MIYTDTRRTARSEGPTSKGSRSWRAPRRFPSSPRAASATLRTSSGVSAMSALGIEGVIVGMALYRGMFTLAEAMRAAGERRAG